MCRPWCDLSRGVARNGEAPISGRGARRSRLALALDVLGQRLLRLLEDVEFFRALDVTHEAELVLRPFERCIAHAPRRRPDFGGDKARAVAAIGGVEGGL